MKLRNVAAAFTIVLVVILLGLVGAGYWLLATPAGARWSFQQIERFAGQAVQVTDAAGTWSSGITLRELRYRDESREVVLGGVMLAVDVARLPRRELFVERLEIGEMALRLFDEEPVEVPVESAGDLSAPLEIVLARGVVDRLILRGETDTVVEDVELSGLWSGSRISVAKLAASALNFNVEADGALVLTDPIQVSAKVAWATSLDDGTQFIGRGNLDGDLAGLDVSHELLAPFVIATEGRIGLGGQPRLELVSSSDELAYPLAGQTIRLTDATLALVGWLGAYSATWSGNLAGEELLPAQLSGSGSGNADSFQLDDLVLALDRGQAALAGRLDWSDGVAWLADIVLSDIDPAQLLPEWPGSLSGALFVSGSHSDAGIVLDARNIDIGGEVRGQPVLLQGSVFADDGLFRVEGLRLSSGPNYVAVNGTYGERMDLSYAADIQDLSVVDESWAGAIKANGMVNGTVAAPELQIEAAARGLKLPQASARQVTVSGRVKDNDDTSAITATADGVQVGQRLVETVRVRARGVLDAHQVDVNVVSEADTFAALLTGGWQAGQWRGQVAEGEAAFAQWGSWRQAAPAALLLDPEQVRIDRLCASDAVATLCFQGGVDASSLALTGQVENVSLQPLSTMLPEGITVTGTLNADLTLDGSLQMPELSFAAALPNVVLSYSIEDEDEALETSLRDVSLTGSGDLSRVNVDLSLTGARQSNLALTASLSDWQQPAPGVQARLRASVPDVAFLSMLYTEVSDWAGSLEADLAVDGQLTAPDVTGFVRLDNGRATLRRAGITVEDIQLNVQPVGGDRLGLTASARSGAGQIRVDGGVELNAEAGWPLYGSVTGERFAALKLPGIDVIVSPDLTISGARNTIRLSGQVLAPRAIVELKELPEQAIEVSPDVIVHGVSEDPQPEKQPLQFYTDLKLVLGDEVRFSGFGLRTDLDGQLALSSEPQRPMEGQGVVNISDGRFQAYGQNLEIENGTLLFDGPLDDPSLDVTAIRRVDGVKVGVRVRGSGRAPQAAIFSDPAMSEGNALSYLVIGRPLAQATSSDGASLKNSAVAMGLKQALPITDQFGEAVGLDELGLDPDNTDTGSVMAGKQITPDLYVRYSYGLFSRLGALLLRYQLNSRLSLEARSSEDQSMDLIYTRARK